MYRDIYEWLLQVKNVERSTIQEIREFERKNACTPFTAIEKLNVCTLSEIQQAIETIYQIQAFSGMLQKLKIHPEIPMETMFDNNFIALIDPTIQTQNKKDILTYVLFFDPRRIITAVDAIKQCGFKGRIAKKWISEDTFNNWKKSNNRAFNNAKLAKITSSIDIVNSMVDDELPIDASVDGETDDAKIVELANELLDKAIELGASDIHIEPFGSGCKIRYRIDGVLALYNVITDKSTYKRLVNRFKVLGRMDVNNSRTPQSGKLRFEMNDVRVSTLPSVSGEKIVLRILNTGKGTIRTLSELGVPEDAERRLRKMFTRPYGIILVSGPTGSGKSSTLAAILSELSNDSVCTITIEDPVEYRIPDAVQVNVNPDAGLTFASVLRETLRQDPNIIMVGEIRDKETAEISMQAANTGHLVFSTIHTNSAVTSITRLNDMGIDGYLVADNIIGIVSQSLVRKLCPYCKKEHIINMNDIQKYYASKSLLGKQAFEPGDGCPHCNGSGYAGRTIAFEILEMNPKIMEAIHEKKPSADIEKVAREQHFINKLEYSYGLVEQGITSLAEVSRVIGGINSEKTDS